MRGAVSTFPPYSQYSTAELLEAYRAAPERVRAVLRGVSPRDLHARPRPGKWTILEIVCHLVDADLIGAVRVRLATAQPGATFPGYDQDQWARELAYEARGPEELEAALQLFGLVRRTNSSIFERADSSEWTDHWGIHPEYGPITLRNVLELYSDHGERHIEQILAIRERLGMPLDLPLLLKDRLY